MLRIFEDDEAVIKMIIKGRSPTMRHVSPTHRVALDWLFHRINLDTKIKSDMLTPKTTSQTYWQRAISHVMSGIIFSICSVSAFSALPVAPQQCRKGWNKEQEKRELWQSRSRRWTWSRVLRQALLQRRVRVHQVVPGYSEHPVRKVRIPQHNALGNQPLEVQIKMTQRQVLKCGKEVQKRTAVRGNSLLQERTRIRVFKNVQRNLPQKIPKSSSTTTRIGRTTTTYLVLTFHISRKSARICDSIIASQKTKWNTSMWIRWYGECLWLSLSKPQFIPETIWLFRESTFFPKISFNEQWNKCSMWQSRWSEIIEKSNENRWSICNKVLGKGRRC